jgi:hypothetical protein
MYELTIVVETPPFNQENITETFEISSDIRSGVRMLLYQLTSVVNNTFKLF